MPKLNWTDLEFEIRETWRGLWHNASLLGMNWGDMSDQEADACNDWINFMIPIWLEQLRDRLHEDHGVLWSLSTYGRGGATVAPDDLPSGHSGDYGRELAEGALCYDSPWEHDLDGYNADYRILCGLRALDAHVREHCKELPQLWEQALADYQWVLDED